jgi:hypothetical protein
MGMDGLIGRHIKNYADRVSPPADMRQQILSRAQEYKVRPPISLMIVAYFRTLGRLLWLFVTLRWLEDGNPGLRPDIFDDYVFDDHALTQWFYRRSTMNSLVFGSGNFTLTG